MLGTLFATADTARAHNSLASSEPVDGAILDAPPTSWVLTFTREVPLDSASAELVLSDGSRSGLSAPVHGASSSVIVFTLPTDLSGEVTGRWRLVGTDGHVITGRVQFSVAAPPRAVTDDTNVDASTTESNPTVAGSAGDGTANGVTDGDGSNADDEAVGIDEADGRDETTPSFVDPISEQVRWVLHLLSYLGLILVGGLVFADVVLARGILRRPRATLAVQGGALLLFVSPALESLIHIADLEGVKLTSAFRFPGSLLDTSAGSMLAARTLIGFVLLMVALTMDQRPMETRFVKRIAAIVTMHIVTLPFTGHSRSMRWPALGVPVDIVHMIGVTVWVGGLVALVVFIMPAAQTASAVVAYVRFSSVASWAVIAIVVTGVVQTVRLHGATPSILDSTHGAILTAKVVLVAVMLAVGWWSRRIVAAGGESDDQQRRALLIRVTGIEAVLGVVVIGVSAALVRAAFTV